MKAQYRFIDAGQILPYGAFGMGPYFTEQETYIGTFDSKKEIGLLALFLNWGSWLTLDNQAGF